MNPFSTFSRREALQRIGFGMGALAASDLLANVREGGMDSPLAPRHPHFPAKAKRVIHLFMNGGPSQIDTFDHKPGLAKFDGKELPDSIKKTLQPTQRNRVGTIWASPFKFSKHGQSGLEISELYPNLAKHADKLCVIRSMESEIANHSPGLLMMNCGHPVLSRPSVGSWVLYGLGTESEDLPGYVVLMPNGMPTAQSRNWTSSFLPGVYQGTHIETNAKGGEMIPHLNRKDIRFGTQRNLLGLTRFLNQEHKKEHPGDERLDSRIHTMELAFRMQSAATDAFDVTKEPQAVRDAYGDTPVGRNLLMARRLAERGVRYVQCYHGAGQPWDSHSGLIPRHQKLAEESDQPIAALLEDLELRGMLEDTLVVWGGEMGRTSTIQKGPSDVNKIGRDHHVDGFTVWMAGGGVKGGTAYGETDEWGLGIASNPVHVHDLHATMLHLLGFDHKKLTYRYSGRDFRLTDVHGHVVEDILA
ncbi:MAG: sulfatase [Verrucomicrobiales bacterium]|nr:sulfatase [Verrucomicrobiales bacterium]